MEINKCPKCGASALSKQPESGLHAYTMYYSCGSKIIYIIGSDSFEVEKECEVTDNDINSVMDDIANISDTFSIKLIKHMEQIENKAYILKDKIEELESSYFGNEKNDETDEKGGDNFNYTSHAILDAMDEIMQKAIDFVVKL